MDPVPAAEPTAAPEWGGPAALPALRLVLVAAQAATILLTWRVWQVRDLPPCLPLLPVPQADMGWPLLATLVLAVAVPRLGVAAHSVALGWALVADQCRMQPHVISLATLLWGTTGRAGGTLVMRAALVAPWFYAGLHKLASPDYYVLTGPWLLRAVWPGGPGWLATPLAAAVALTEIGLAAGALVPRFRAVVGAVAAVFHVATVVVLALRLHWDVPVWPWNLALACAAPVVMTRWGGPGLGAAWRRASPPARAAAVVLLVMPAGYWFGVVDAFLAHCLYSDNTPRAFVCTPFSRTDVRAICNGHGVILPPAHRLYPPFFRSVGRPGEWLEIEDPRWIARVRGLDRRKIFWTDLAGPAPPEAPPGPRPADRSPGP